MGEAKNNNWRGQIQSIWWITMVDTKNIEKDANKDETIVDNYSELAPKVVDNDGVMIIKTEEAKQAEKAQADKTEETRG